MLKLLRFVVLLLLLTDIVGNKAIANNYYATRNADRYLLTGNSLNVTPQTITFNSLPAKTYGDADFSLSATASSALPVGYSSSNTAVATVNAQGTVHILSAGTTTITASQPGDVNYSAATNVQQTLTVNKAALTVTANNVSKTYGLANPAFTVAYSGFVNGETNTSLTTPPVAGTTATTASPVGLYPITVTGVSAANYNINYVSGTLSVFPGIQTITFNPLSKTYGDADFALSATASSGLPITYTSSNPAIATVDAGGIVHIVSAGNVIITAQQAGNGNFLATTNFNQQLVIGKATLTLTADHQTKTYGSANPALTVTYSGFVNGDTQTSLTTRPAVSTTATPASDVGDYPISVSGVSASSNYNFNYVNGVLTVGQSSQTIAFAPLQNKTYSDADFSLSASASSGLPVTYRNSNPMVATVDSLLGTVHILSAGTTIITASQPGNNNYIRAAGITQTLTVNKAPLNIIADNKSKTYGAANPALTIAYTGFVNGDTQTTLTAQPTVSTTATVASAAGTYPIMVGGANSDNYAIAYTAGTFTVLKTVLTITADNQSRVYGLPNPALTVTYLGFVNGDTQTSLSTPPAVATTATAASAAGSYPVTANGAVAANYSFTYVPGTLTITNPTVSSISLTQVGLFENQPSGTQAGTLSAVSLDPNAAYTYSFVSGAGSTDNALFSIQGNKVITNQSLDFEQKASYQVLIRATNQYGLYLDQAFIININDVNEAPTMAAVPDQGTCFTTSSQVIKLSGITPGPETAQSTTLSVSSSNAGLFNNLSVSAVSGGQATLSYNLAKAGTAVVTVTVKDNGGTANGGIDSFSQTFTLTSNDLPAAAIAADKGTLILKGETVTLTATGGGTYSWDNTAGTIGSTSTAVIQVRPDRTTTYQVKATNASGCSSNSSITINVTDDYASIHPANLLTPNGDGKNDTWVVKNIELYPDNTVSIYDKGGRLLHKISRYNNDWDGSYNGSPLAEGTYYYVIDFSSGKYLLKGFVTILRNR